MSFILKFNVLKGWPNPAIVEKVAKPASGVTIEEGMVGHLDSSGNWVLGVSAITQEAFVFRNGSGDSDANHEFASDQDYQHVNWGGIQGLAHSNPLEYQTAQYGGSQTPALNDQLYADTDGKLKVAVDAAGNLVAASKAIVAICTRGVHAGTGQGPVNLIDVRPDTSKRLSPAS